MKRMWIWTAVPALLFAAACSDRHDHAHEAPAAVEQPATQPQVMNDITVLNAWVRPTVGAQDATGAYLTISSQENLALTGVASPVAEIAEVHQMIMDGDVMRMRMAERIEIKAGEPLELRPGGYHVMLMALTAPIEIGQEIELSLQFEKPDGSKIEMPVKAVAAQNTGGDHHHGGGDHKH